MARHSRINTRDNGLAIKTAARKISVILFLLISCVLIISNKFDQEIISKVRIKTVDILSPFIDTLSRPWSESVKYVERIGSLFVVTKENEILKKENEFLKHKLISYENLTAENSRLQELLSFTSILNMSYVSSTIIGDNSGPFNRLALINAGEKHSIKKGEAVINQEGLVGRIIEVGSKTARVLMITDLNSKIPVISTNSREHAIAAGTNANYLRVLYLGNNSKVQAGEVVVTSGDDNLFPKGLPVGIIEKNTKDEFIIKPFVEWARLEQVSIVKTDSR